MERAEYWSIVRGQAATLATSIDAVRQGLAAEAVPAWRPGECVGILAMGASTYAAEYLVEAARQRGRTVINWAASDWRDAGTPPAVRIALGISESGRSPETIAAIERVPADHRLVITNVPGSPVTALARTVSLGGVPDAGVYVSGYTSTLAALALLGEAWGLDGCADGLADAPRLVDEVLPAAERAVGAWLHQGHGVPGSIECVGAGYHVAAANETALLLREAGRIPSAAYPTDQYLHGPAEALPGRAGLFVIGSGRADELAARMVALRVPVLHVSTAPVDGSVPVVLPEASPAVTAILAAVVGQVLAGRIGDVGGHEIGTFAHEFDGTKLPPT